MSLLHNPTPQEIDRMCRTIVVRALKECGLVAVPGIEYAPDMHLCRKEDCQGYVPDSGQELSDSVPTLVVELKGTTCPNHSENDDQQNRQIRLKWTGCHKYQDQLGTVVVMLYIPKGITEETLEQLETLESMKFWIRDARHPKLMGPPSRPGEIHTRLNSNEKGPDGQDTAAGKMYSCEELLEVLQAEVHRRAGEEGGLLPYGHHSRAFKSESHATGQAIIDAHERQVLRPQGARILPPEGGGEGGATDARIEFANGKVVSVQYASTKRHKKASGFCVHAKRHNGTYRNAKGKKIKQFKPYEKGENDFYIFVRLAPDGVTLLEYWAATEEDMIGEEGDTAYITNNDTTGVTGFTVHPHKKDKKRLGDTSRVKDDNRSASRTRKWVQALGRIHSHMAGDEARTQEQAKVNKKRKRAEKLDEEEQIADVMQASMQQEHAKDVTEFEGKETTKVAVHSDVEVANVEVDAKTRALREVAAKLSRVF